MLQARESKSSIAKIISAIVTVNDRASGMLWMRKVATRDAAMVRLKMCEILEEIKTFIKTITHSFRSNQ
ncbi:MAG: hypothetical protein H0V01_12835 [Bacteroidetes bacterium]|nr:hypothetical protein [Bacteroidota bacterium]HET6246016.1 hypothetical protein [Bacteroidia bacterium]